tara:strand:+ start:18354 stop:18551 length:198 start_codon:yes stop_codon:yes gene_type:complete
MHMVEAVVLFISGTLLLFMVKKVYPFSLKEFSPVVLFIQQHPKFNLAVGILSLLYSVFLTVQLVW